MSDETTPKGPIAWMVRNPVAANLGMGMVCLAGLLGTSTLRQEVFPEFSLDVIRVEVPYPGASPEECEQGIVLAVEEAVRGLDGVKRVTSVARQGSATVSLELLNGVDENDVAANVKSQIDRIQSLPVDAEEPTVTVASRRRQVLSLVLAGDIPLSTLHSMAESARSELLRRPGITQVELGGVRPLELSIEVPRENLEAYQLTLEEVADQVRAASLELPGGGLDTRSGEVLVRMADRQLSSTDFEELIIRTGDVGEVRLGEIAHVEDGYASTDLEEYYNGLRAVSLIVYRVGDETPTAIADQVKSFADELRSELPSSVSLALWNDESKLLAERIDLLVRNGRTGLLLVLIVLGLFLKPQLAGWVALGIPISFLGSFLMMGPLDLTINMITLFALLITLGMVVDDAIVVGENIYAKTEQGMAAPKAAVLGATEMATPVTFAILTTIVAFSPLLVVPGPLGQIFRLIPLIVVAVLSMSLLESFFVLPAHLAHGPSTRLLWLTRPLERIQTPVSRTMDSLIRRAYSPTLRVALNYRYTALAASVALLIMTIGLVASGLIPLTFAPKLESDLVVASARLPFGSPLSQTLEVGEKLNQAAKQAMRELDAEDAVLGTFTRVGKGPSSRDPASAGPQEGSHLVTLEVSLVSSELRGFEAEGFRNAWLRSLPALAGVEALSIKSDISGPGSNSLEVQLSHPDTHVLEDASSRVTSALRAYEGLINVENGFAAGKQRLDYRLRPEARSLGITSSDVGRQLRASFFGAEVLREQRGRNERRVYVRLPEEQRDMEADLDALMVRAPSGGFVPLGLVSERARSRAPTVINREGGQRTVSVKADLGPTLSSPREIIASLTAEVFPAIESEFPGLNAGLIGEQREQGESVASLGRNFLLALFGIYALLAIPFRSYVQPLIVMSAIPFGIVGAVFGHVLLGYGLSVISMMGVIALSGVVVNDSLVLVDAINRYRSKGMTLVEAVVAGGTRRFRPIFLTSITTFFGLVPIILETSIQAQFMVPMALSLGFGVLFATVIVLLAVPCLYVAVEDMGRLANGPMPWSRALATTSKPRP
ncbi:MAG: efflux RND transporter permease subunit [Myxococcota bacterium]